MEYVFKNIDGVVKTPLSEAETLRRIQGIFFENELEAMDVPVKLAMPLTLEEGFVYVKEYCPDIEFTMKMIRYTCKSINDDLLGHHDELSDAFESDCNYHYISKEVCTVADDDEYDFWDVEEDYQKHVRSSNDEVSDSLGIMCAEVKFLLGNGLSIDEIKGQVDLAHNETPLPIDYAELDEIEIMKLIDIYLNDGDFNSVEILENIHGLIEDYWELHQM